MNQRVSDTERVSLDHTKKNEPECLKPKWCLETTLTGTGCLETTLTGSGFARLGNSWFRMSDTVKAAVNTVLGRVELRFFRSWTILCW